MFLVLPFFSSLDRERENTGLHAGLEPTTLRSWPQPIKSLTLNWLSHAGARGSILFIFSRTSFLQWSPSLPYHWFLPLGWPVINKHAPELHCVIRKSPDTRSYLNTGEWNYIKNQLCYPYTLCMQPHFACDFHTGHCRLYNISITGESSMGQHYSSISYFKNKQTAPAIILYPYSGCQLIFLLPLTAILLKRVVCSYYLYFPNSFSPNLLKSRSPFQTPLKLVSSSY